MASPPTSSLASYCPDLGDWPASWEIDDGDQIVGQRISTCLTTQRLFRQRIRKTEGFPFDAILSSHCLPTGDNAPFWTDDYDEFLHWREARLWQEIKLVTGISDATNLEAEPDNVD